MKPITHMETPLFGRSNEVRMLTDLIRSVRQGETAFVFVRGEAGIGKSRLLAEALEFAASQGFVVLKGRASELEQAQPFGLIASAFELSLSSPDSQRSAIARVLAGFDDDADALENGPSIQFRVVEEIVDLIDEATGKNPVALILDDLQWSDPASLLALAAIRRRMPSASLVMLGACRPSPQNRELENLIYDAVATGDQALELARLDSTAVRDLVEFLVPDGPSKEISETVARGGGNPLFIVEIVHAMLGVDANKAGSFASLESLRFALSRRLRGLSEEAGQMLKVASVLGPTFRPTDLTTILGKRSVDLLPVLQEAERDGILSEQEGRLAFRHDLIRDALYFEIPEDIRASFHVDAARALASAGASPVQVASHFAIGAREGDSEAADWLVRVGRSLTHTSPAIAVQFLTRALEILGAGPPEMDEIQASLGTALSWAGRLDEATALAKEILDRASSDAMKAIAAMPLFNALTLQGRGREARELMSEFLDEPSLTPADRARRYAFQAMSRLFLGEFDQAQADAEIVLPEAQRLNEPWATSVALITLAWAEASRGNVPKALEISSRAMTIADHHPLIELFHGSILASADRYEESESILNAGLAFVERSGQILLTPLYYWILMGLHFRAGNWEDAVAEAETGLSIVEELGISTGVLWPLSGLAYMAARRGDTVAARGLIDKGQSYALRSAHLETHRGHSSPSHL